MVNSGFGRLLGLLKYSNSKEARRKEATQVATPQNRCSLADVDLGDPLFFTAKLGSFVL
jgi:hypothetical protein